MTNMEDSPDGKGSVGGENQMEEGNEELRKVPLWRITSQINEMSQRMRSIYTTTVSIPSVYTEHKHQQYGTLKNFLRKLAGIPFAALYAFLLVWIISDLIIGKPGLSFTSESDLEMIDVQSICAAIISAENATKQTATKDFRNAKPMTRPAFVAASSSHEYYVKKSYRNGSSPYSPEGRGIFFENDSMELYSITGGVMGALGIYSIFSRNIRATMLLILPGLVTRHSRHFIYTIILGMLMNGPVQSLKVNFHKLLQNAGQTQQQSITKLCETGLEFERDAKKYYTMYTNVRKAVCADCWIPTRRPFSSILEALNTGPITEAIKEQASIVIEKVYAVGYYVDLMRKVITVLSIVMLIVDAVRYLRSYYTDSSFDNMYVGRTARRHWEKRDYFQDWEDFSNTGWNDAQGLRNWEINKGFKTWNITKLTKREVFKVLRNSLTTFVFISFVALVLGTDYLLSEAVQHISDNAHATGSIQNLTSPNANVALLSKPYRTSTKLYWIITLLLIGAVVSCIFEVFMSRIRAKLCNLFYPDRAKERADFLCYNLAMGRIERQFHLLLLVRREVERRRKLVKFSPLERIKQCFGNCFPVKSGRVVCAACQWNVKVAETRDLKFCVLDKKQSARICLNCELDILNKNTTTNGGDVLKSEVIDGGCF